MTESLRVAPLQYRREGYEMDDVKKQVAQDVQEAIRQMLSEKYPDVELHENSELVLQFRVKPTESLRRRHFIVRLSERES